MSQKVSQLKFQIEMQDSVFSSDFNFVIADSRILYSVFFLEGGIYSPFQRVLKLKSVTMIINLSQRLTERLI